MPKTIIFDFDGTIADSLSEAINVAYSLTKQPKLLDPNVISRLRNHPLTDMSSELGIPKYKWPYLLVKGRVVLGEKIKTVKPFPGITAAIKELNDAGYILFLMSSNSSENISEFLKNNGINKSFIKIYGGVGLFSKTLALRRILSVNHLAPSQTIYVGDEPRDIEAAKKNKMEAIAVGWGYNTPQLLKESKPFRIANTPEDIVKYVEKWEASSDR